MPTTREMMAAIAQDRTTPRRCVHCGYALRLPLEACFVDGSGEGCCGGCERFITIHDTEPIPTGQAATDPLARPCRRCGEENTTPAGPLCVHCQHEARIRQREDHCANCGSHHDGRGTFCPTCERSALGLEPDQGPQALFQAWERVSAAAQAARSDRNARYEIYKTAQQVFEEAIAAEEAAWQAVEKLRASYEERR